MKPTKHKKSQLPESVKKKLAEIIARLSREEQAKKLKAEEQRQRTYFARENACDY